MTPKVDNRPIALYTSGRNRRGHYRPTNSSEFSGQAL